MKSWVERANGGDTHFPLRNLPLGVAGEAPGCATIIGSQVMRLASLEQAGLLALPGERMTGERHAEPAALRTN
ncbi:MAG: hypothetical protein GKR94_13910 [Gammaproteobacteria bacterium]|nr:hypothetical protein [Gammaproteobacteria bacterium]